MSVVQVPPLTGGGRPQGTLPPVAPVDDWQRRLSTAIPILLSALLFAVPFSVAVETARHFSGVAIDGPFQLYDALRRIEAGYRPGIDFQFFHGLGIPYLHYPLYRLLGGGLAGAELARQLLSVVVCPLVLLAVFRAFTGDWKTTWYLTAGALAASLALHMTALLTALNGMLGLRSAIPTLLPIVLYVSPNRRVRTIAAGLTLGIAMLVSTEQGIAAVLAYSLVSIIRLASPSNERGRGRGRTIEMAGALAIAVLTFLLALVFIGGLGGAAGALRYNLRLVSMDQYWYFGVPPNLFISSWLSAVVLLSRFWSVGLGLALAVLMAVVHVRRLWRVPAGEPCERQFALTVLAIYGLVSCSTLLGIFMISYVEPSWRVLILLGLLELARVTKLFDSRRAPGRAAHATQWIAGAAMLCVGWMFVAAPASVSILWSSLPHVLRDHVFRRVPFQAAGIWPKTLRDGQRILDEHRSANGALPSLWSTYAGWLEARNGMFHPSFDYIIHALGPENRAAYLAAFRTVSPRLVQTVRPGYSPYEEWVEGTSWDFYQELLRNYAVVATTPWSVFWDRQAAAKAAPQPLGTVTPIAGAGGVRLPIVPSTPGMPVTLLTVEIAYKVRNPWRALPLVGASPRYLLSIRGAANRIAVSLSPYDSVARFPVIGVPGTAPLLGFRTFSLLPGASFEVRSVRVSAVDVDPRNAVWLAELVQQQPGR